MKLSYLRNWFLLSNHLSFNVKWSRTSIYYSCSFTEFYWIYKEAFKWTYLTFIFIFFIRITTVCFITIIIRIWIIVYIIIIINWVIGTVLLLSNGITANITNVLAKSPKVNTRRTDLCIFCVTIKNIFELRIIVKKSYVAE